MQSFYVSKLTWFMMDFLECMYDYIYLWDYVGTWRPWGPIQKLLYHYYFFSAVKTRERIWFERANVHVFSSGLVYFKIRSDFTTTCSLNMQMFPFDTQTCSIDVSLQEYGTYQVNFTNGKCQHCKQLYLCSIASYLQMICILNKSTMNIMKASHRAPIKAVFTMGVLSKLRGNVYSATGHCVKRSWHSKLTIVHPICKWSDSLCFAY